MDVFTRPRFTICIFVLLAGLNVLTLSVIWLTREPAPPSSPPADRDSGQARHFLEKELGLSPDQIVRYEALQARYKKQGRILEEEIHELRRQMMDQLARPEPDFSLVDRLASGIGARQAEVDKATFLHIMEIKAICTPDQQVKLTGIFREVLRAIRPAGPPAGAGEPPRGRERPRRDPPPGGEEPPPPREAPPDRQRPPE